MSIKTYSRIIPVLTNYLKCSSSVFSRSIEVQLKNRNLVSHISASTTGVRLASTKQIKINSKSASSNVKEIYYGVLTPQIRAVKIFSLTSSIVGIICQPFLYKEIVATGNVPIIIGAYSFIGFFTIVTPVLLHFITKKYIISLEYKEDTDSYIAKTVNFFCITKKTEFKPEDVEVPDIPGMFTTFCVKGKQLFMDPRLFEETKHYAKIMGYDKPIDFKLYDTPSKDNKNSKS